MSKQASDQSQTDGLAPKSPFLKLHASQIGVNVPTRGCTDVPCFLLFLICWAGMGYVAWLAFSHGDLDRLTFGTDYLGNVCGHGTPKNITNATVVADWPNRQYLWYPVTYNLQTRTFNIKSAVKLGVCVSSCPGTRERVPLYGPSDPTLPDYWTSLFDSELQFNRCVPNIISFDCSNATASDSQPNATSTCQIQVFSASKDMKDSLGLANAAFRGFAELKENWWVVLSCFGIALVVCFLWLFILRRVVKPVVILTIILLVGGLGAIGYFLFYQSQQIKRTAGTQTDSYEWYFYGAIAVWVVDFLILCVVVFIFRDLMIAADIIEEASKIPIAIPTMMLVPPVTVIFAIGFVMFALFVAAFTYTAGGAAPVILLVPSRDLNGTVSVSRQEFEVANWQPYAYAYTVFMFLWSVAFIGAIDFMVLAFCSTFWYWSRPGDDKNPEHGVAAALGLTLRNHLGSLAFGSLLIAILQFLRLTIHLMEERLDKVAKNVNAVKFLMACAQCCLACFERCVKFMNKNAYIVQTMTGESFISAARHALSLLAAHALSVGAVSIIGEYVMFFGKVFITAGVTASAYGIMTGTAKGRAATSDSTAGMILILIAVAVMAYVVSAIFINVFGVCVDSVLLSYCYDIEQNNGTDRPYYAPDDLKKHIDRAKTERAMRNDVSNLNAGGSDTSVPLKASS